MAIFNSYVTNYQRVNLGDGLSLGLMNLVLFSPQDWLKKPAEVRVFQPPGLCEGRMSNVLANINTHTHTVGRTSNGGWGGKKIRKVGEICAEENGESMVYNMKSMVYNTYCSNLVGKICQSSSAPLRTAWQSPSLRMLRRRESWSRQHQPWAMFETFETPVGWWL